MKVDLHCHSTNSDGTWSVEKILNAAEVKGIKILAITDHDNFKGSLEAQKLKSGMFSGLLIPGIEISTKIKGKSMHFLAYFPSFDLPKDSELLQNLDKIKNSRIWRMKEMIKKAIELGFDVTFDDVLKEASKGGVGGKQPTDILSRPHLARVLVEKGYVESFNVAFNEYLADGKPIHVSRFTLDIDDWIKQVSDLSGIVVWAHPLHNHKEDLAEFKEFAEYIFSKNITGVERIYYYAAKYKISKGYEASGNAILDKLIERNSLLITSGGDFHGDTGTLGELELDVDNIDLIKSKLLIS